MQSIFIQHGRVNSQHHIPDLAGCLLDQVEGIIQPAVDVRVDIFTQLVFDDLQVQA